MHAVLSAVTPVKRWILMSKQFLYDYQMDAVERMSNGCILNGGVGSGKSRTGLYYYFKEQGGSINPDYVKMKRPKTFTLSLLHESAIPLNGKANSHISACLLIPRLLYILTKS